VIELLEHDGSDVTARPPAEPAERRSGVDRRSGRDRRTVDLWREIGRPGFDLRTGQERRSHRDRRHTRSEVTPQDAERPRDDIVTPWQIPELTAR